MGWVNESVINNTISWQTYRPRFLVLKGTDSLLFDTPPVSRFGALICNIKIFKMSHYFNIKIQLNANDFTTAPTIYKIYQSMFRVIKESETVDGRQHCFMLQSSPPDAAPRYLSVDTRQELVCIETSWNSSIITSVIKLGVREIFVVV